MRFISHNTAQIATICKGKAMTNAKSPIPMANIPDIFNVVIIPLSYHTQV